MIENLKLIFKDIKLILILVLLCICGIMGYTKNSKIIIAGIVLVLLFMEGANILKSKKFRWHYSFVIILLFSFFSLLSSIWAYDKELSVNRFFALFVLDVFYIVSWNIFLSKKNAFDIIITLIMISGIIISIYTLKYYGISNFFKLLSKSKRIGSDITNVNTIGLTTIFSVICCIYFFNKDKKIYYLILASVPLIVSLGTGSRKVLLSLFITIGIFILAEKKRNIPESLKKILKYSVVIIIVFWVLSLPAFSNIMKRFEGLLNVFNSKKVDYSTSVRELLIKKGYDIWQENFFWRYWNKQFRV